MKQILLSSLAALVLISVVGCSDTSSTTSSTMPSSAPMQADSKDMKK